jgi:hypothetical protein
LRSDRPTTQSVRSVLHRQMYPQSLARPSVLSAHYHQMYLLYPVHLSVLSVLHHQMYPQCPAHLSIRLALSVPRHQMCLQSPAFPMDRSGRSLQLQSALHPQRLPVLLSFQSGLSLQ